MKLAKIGLLILLGVAGGIPGMGPASAQQQEPVTTTPESTQPQQIVRDYYQAYIAWLHYDFQKQDKTVKPVANRRLDPSFVTPHFIDSYKKLMQENDKLTPEGMAGPLDYDPIICAQDYPDNMAQASVVLVKNTGTKAEVKVDLTGQKSEPPLVVKLKKLPEGWRIDSILCGKDDFDSLYKSMKKQEKQ